MDNTVTKGIHMKKLMFFIPVFGLALSGCSTINATMRGLEENQQAIDMSTDSINANTQAVENANRDIAENRRKLEAINQTLKNAGASTTGGQK
jgi:starvation-inducible outer membrane lipoprotein